MKWQKGQADPKELQYHYVDSGEYLNRVVEIIHTKKNTFKVSCYTNDSLDSVENVKSFKTLPEAKRHGEKWMRKQVKLLLADIKKFMESK
jgi:hypothetical protein